MTAAPLHKKGDNNASDPNQCSQIQQQVVVMPPGSTGQQNQQYVVFTNNQGQVRGGGGGRKCEKRLRGNATGLLMTSSTTR